MCWAYIVIFTGQTILRRAIDINGKILFMIMLLEVQMLKFLEAILDAIALSFSKFGFSCPSVQSIHLLCALISLTGRLMTDKQVTLPFKLQHN